MLRKLSIAMLTVTCLTLAPQKVFGSFLVGDDTIVSQTKRAVLIVAGNVSDIQYVQPNSNIARVYTDVTINVSNTLKGTPNIDEDTVRFRIEGGIGIHPLNGRTFIEEVSTVQEFRRGQELILFLEKRTLDDWSKFYGGLYPLMYPPYPKIDKVQVNGEEYKIARFHLAFFHESYRLNIPVDIAFRLIDNAIKAPEDLSLLEEKIRPLKDTTFAKNQGQEVEPEKFLSMLRTELAKIETKIAEREAADEQ